jgi:hypothetical protein
MELENTTQQKKRAKKEKRKLLKQARTMLKTSLRFQKPKSEVQINESARHRQAKHDGGVSATLGQSGS